MNLNILFQIIGAGILLLFIGFSALLIFTSKDPEPIDSKKHKDDNYNNSYQNLETIMHDVFDSNSNNP